MKGRQRRAQALERGLPQRRREQPRADPRLHPQRVGGQLPVAFRPVELPGQQSRIETAVGLGQEFGHRLLQTAPTQGLELGQALGRAAMARRGEGIEQPGAAQGALGGLVT